LHSKRLNLGTSHRENGTNDGERSPVEIYNKTKKPLPQGAEDCSVMLLKKYVEVENSPGYMEDGHTRFLTYLDEIESKGIGAIHKTPAMREMIE